jgi:hypothetical protein
MDQEVREQNSKEKKKEKKVNHHDQNGRMSRKKEKQQQQQQQQQQRNIWSPFVRRPEIHPRFHTHTPSGEVTDRVDGVV